MLLGVIAFLIAFSLAGPKLYPNPAFFMTMVIYMVLATSLNIIYGYTGYLPFGFAVFFAIGAYGFGMGIKFHYDIVESMIFGLGISLLLSLAFLPLLRLRGVYFSVATLGAFEAVLYLVSISTGPIARYTGGAAQGISIPQIYAPYETYHIAIALLIIAVLVSFFVKQSKFGLALRAIKNDVLSASISGVNVSLNRNIAWWITAVIAGAAGALYGWYSAFFYPDNVFDIISFTLFPLVFLIFGGRGTVIGPIIGALVLYSVYNFAGLNFSTYFQAAFGIVVIIIILFIPNGILDIVKKTTKQEVI